MMKTILLCFVTMMFALLPLATGIAQDCADYTVLDHWVPTPWLGDATVYASARWDQGSIVFCTGDKTAVVDFSDPQAPRLIGSALGKATSMAIDGDRVAVGDDTGVSLRSLPGLELLARFPTGARTVPALHGSWLATADGTEIEIFDVANPIEPRVVGSLNLGLFTYETPRIAFCDGFLVYMNRFGNLRPYGQLWVIDPSGQGGPTVTDLIGQYPYDESLEVTFHGISAMGDRHYIAGTAYRDGSKPWYLPASGYTGFVAEFGVTATGMASFGRLGTMGEFFINGLTSLGNAFLASGYHVDSIEPNTSVTQGSWSVQMPEEGDAVLPISILARTFDSRPVTILPDHHIVAEGKYISWVLNPLAQRVVLPGYGITDHKLEARDGLIVELRWISYYDMGGYSGWFVSFYDASLDPPAYLGNSGNSNLGTMEDLRLVGRRAYVRSDDTSSYWQYIELSGPSSVGPVTPGGLVDCADVLGWDDYLVYVKRNGTLVVRPASSDTDADALAVLPVGRSGYLFRAGQMLYVTDPDGGQIVDLADPTSPQVVAVDLPMVGRFLDRSGEVGFARAGSRINAWDLSDPGHPVLVATWDGGAPIADLVVTGNRIYAAMGARGLAVLAWNRETGIRLIGGSLRPYSSTLAIVGSRLYTAGLQTLPLECQDSVPTVIQRFEAVWQDDGARISWTARGTSAAVPVSVHRRTRHSEIVVFATHLGAGIEGIVDRTAVPAANHRYELIGDTGAVLASCELAARPVGMHLGLTVAPNPANPLTQVRFVLDRPQHVRVDVYGLDGRRVACLANEDMPAFTHSVSWDGRDDAGRRVASGAYLIRVQTETLVESTRLAIVR